MTERPPESVTDVPAGGCSHDAPILLRISDRCPHRVAFFPCSVIRRNADLADRSNGSVDNRIIAPGVNTIDEAAGLQYEGTYRGRLRIEHTSKLGSIIPRNNPPSEAQSIILAHFL